jgi:hypothetical protein
LALTGPDGLLGQSTKRVPESALEICDRSSHRFGSTRTTGPHTQRRCPANSAPETGDAKTPPSRVPIRRAHLLGGLGDGLKAVHPPVPQVRRLRWKRQIAASR